MIFEKKLKIRLICNVAYLILGVISITLGILKIYYSRAYEPTTYYFATGCALIFGSVRKLKQTKAALSDTKKLESLKIEEHDEWNLTVRYKAAYFAFSTAIILFYMVSLVFLFINSSLYLPFIIVNAILVIFYLFYWAMLRKLS